MQSAPVPVNEAFRLAALDSYDLMYSPAEERFDRITRIAAHALHAPIALISFVGASHQWFKSRVGLAMDQTSRDVSFCAHAILHERPFIVMDAKSDERFCDNPLVIGPPYIRFYAGIPLRLVDGLMVGALCVIDTVPRGLSARELSILGDLASVTECELQQEKSNVHWRAESSLMVQGKRPALLDPVTGSWNRAGFEALLQTEVEHAAKHDSAFALIMLVLDEFKPLVDREGAAFGERLLVDVGSRLRRALGGTGTVTRLGDEAFGLVVSPCDKSMLARVQRNVRTAIQARPFLLEPDRLLYLTVSIGAAMVSRPGFDGALALVDADRRLNQARRARIGYP